MSMAEKIAKKLAPALYAEWPMDTDWLAAQIAVILEPDVARGLRDIELDKVNARLDDLAQRLVRVEMSREEREWIDAPRVGREEI
jgi:hypothetical protein